MKKFFMIIIALLALSLAAIHCSDYDFNNPYDSRNLPIVINNCGEYDSETQLCDNRDGQVYRFVEMPDGKTWMAENLNYVIADGSDSWCYDDDPDNCDIYGRLYSWDIAMFGSSSSSANPSGVRGICPAGWHLPSQEEWNTLVISVGDNAGTKLKSSDVWEPHSTPAGTDDFGFSALPGGRFQSSLTGGNGFFTRVGYDGSWWTATDAAGTGSDGYAWSPTMHYSWEGVAIEGVVTSTSTVRIKTDGVSVRCVKDVRQ